MTRQQERADYSNDTVDELKTTTLLNIRHRHLHLPPVLLICYIVVWMSVGITGVHAAIIKLITHLDYGSFLLQEQQ